MERTDKPKNIKITSYSLLKAIKSVVEILETLATMTDEFQSNNVTSSGIIFGLISALIGK